MTLLKAKQAIMDKELDFLATSRILPSHPTVTERYFKPTFYGTGDSSQCVITHSNKLNIVTISPHHPIIVDKKTVNSVNFGISGQINRLNNKVSGRFKRGGQKMKENSVLCSVKCSDDSEYTFLSCVHGTLVEINERLLTNPTLLHEKPWSDGYIAIVLPILPRK